MADAPLKSDAIKASGGPALTNRSKFITDAQGRTWFQESSDMWAGCAMTLEVKEVLHEEKTQYQDLMVFQSTTFGKVRAPTGREPRACRERGRANATRAETGASCHFLTPSLRSHALPVPQRADLPRCRPRLRRRRRGCWRHAGATAGRRYPADGPR